MKTAKTLKLLIAICIIHTVGFAIQTKAQETAEQTDAVQANKNAQDVDLNEVLKNAEKSKSDDKNSADTISGSHVFSPDGCEFQVVFPKAPYTTRRCHPTITDKCELMTGFDKSYSQGSVTNFYAKCEMTDDNAMEKYSEDVIRTTLIARAGTRLESTQMAYEENDKSRMGVLLGAGPSRNGEDTLLYVGQIWAGENSIMTIEGELVGDEYRPADRDFANILRSIRHIDDVNLQTTSDAQQENDDDNSEPEIKNTNE